MSERPLLILIAGPYRTGTGDDPKLLAANVRAQAEASVVLFRRGHIPLSGEIICPPIVEAAGSTKVGDAIFDEIFHPYAVRLIERCDAVLRFGGPSVGAEEMLRLARHHGIRIFSHIDDVPDISTQEAAR
ncbi:hypothetical protein ACFSM5_15045 [Lacibacterium aquatile]|uniref:DUF4406 domain-containing protein n=1 Tax=Lacibacterium aquatile TaxID=1168082 RepID=A0ABW5DTG9_9PROT